MKPNSKKQRQKCVRVEWDLSFFGGDYSDVGTFVHIPLALIDRMKGRGENTRLEKAFTQMTKQEPVHIIHWSPDEFYDQDGKEWADEE
jgi:hypothetical protein